MMRTKLDNYLRRLALNYQIDTMRIPSCPLPRSARITELPDTFLEQYRYRITIGNERDYLELSERLQRLDMIKHPTIVQKPGWLADLVCRSESITNAALWGCCKFATICSAGLVLVALVR